MAHSILTNTAIASAGRVINVLLGIVVTGLITRYLGVSQYGLYALLISFGTIIQLLADGGLYLTLTKEIAGQPAQAANTVAHITGLRLFLLALTFTLGTLLTFVIPALQELTIIFIIAGFGLVSQSLSQLSMGIFQHFRSIWRATAGDLVGRVVQISIIIAIGASRATLAGIVMAFSLGAAAALAAHAKLASQFVRLRLAANKQAWQKTMKRSWPIGLLLLLNVIYFRIDAVILASLTDSAIVGFYGIAYRIIESTLFFPAMLGGLLLPRLIEKKAASDRFGTRQLITEGFKVLGLVAGLAVVMLLAQSEAMIGLIAGPGFSQAAPLAQVLSAAMAIMFIGNLFGFTLIAFEKQLALLKLYGVLAVVNTIANLIFIPHFAATAAAWTTVATEGCAAAYAGYLVYKSTGWQLPTGFLLRLGGTIVAVTLLTAAVPSSVGLIMQLIAITAVYAVIAWLTGILSLQSFQALRANQ